MTRSLFKLCRGCDTAKALSDYYVHPQMADGHLNICKECIKERARRHGKQDKVRERNRKRSKQPHRVAARAEYERTHPKEKAARRAVHKAVKSGRLTRPDICSVCDVVCIPDGHHEDYDKPLDVMWMCRSCHQQHHAGSLQPA